MRTPLVTIAIPIYRRLDYLPGALRSVSAQTHPQIDLLISDNGRNVGSLERTLERERSRPYRLRRNSQTVPMWEHFNQLVEAARGEYFVLLSDDDELGPDYVSRTLAALERHRDAGAALARLQVIGENGEGVGRERQMDPPSALMSGAELVRLWCRGEYDFVCFTTLTARTEEIRRVGGYPELPKGTSIDNALLLKLCLDRSIAFVADATFRYRVYERSHGLALPYRELARDLKGFLEFLDRDQTLRAFATEHPDDWRELRALLVEMTWRTYRHRWKKMYRQRLSRAEWVRAAFAMPFIPEYYRSISATLLRRGLSAVKKRYVINDM